ncbi:MAG: FKBP-type peptidyl-prolyl cis-trans isomerase SlyD [uncultured marine phage]|uniref:peptidylprolyl isomerase n=1 Tax=uncultured marine phage TaxID=707152 RepID=A0A8D9FR41_9VIRU|nr:MAG: FKBP-type peptidyl-prolyl cis-trans isomerase SlyD [uncultured marine phage]
MKEAKIGDNVKVHYTGKIKDGEVFDSSRERDPFEFVLGQNQVIPGFEKAVEGLNIGDSVTVDITPEEGYGQRVEQMVQSVMTSMLPEGAGVGMQVRGTDPSGQPIIATIVEINENVDFTDATGTTHPSTSVAKMDFNHPLAGKTLEFEIQLIELAKQNPEDSKSEGND